MIIRMNVPLATMRQKMEQDALQVHLINHLGRAGPGGASQKAKKEKASTPGKKAVEPTAPTPIILLAEDTCSRRSRGRKKSRIQTYEKKLPEFTLKLCHF